MVESARGKPVLLNRPSHAAWVGRCSAEQGLGRLAGTPQLACQAVMFNAGSGGLLLLS